MEDRGRSRRRAPFMHSAAASGVMELQKLQTHHQLGPPHLENLPFQPHPPPEIIPMNTQNSTPTPPLKLVSSIDIGSNTFKLLLVRALPNGRFLTVDRIKRPVLLGRSLIPAVQSASPVTISHPSLLHSISALRSFSQILQLRGVDSVSVVATSAVRESENQSEFVARIKQEVGFDVNVVSGEEEARLVYAGVLQFLPVYSKTILAIDIGGGSTEFVVGREGKVIFAASLNLGHVSLTEGFVKSGDFAGMQKHIRSVILGSQVVEKVGGIGFEIAVGCSGTIRSIESAIFQMTVGSAGLCRDWGFSREELGIVLKRLLRGDEPKEIGFSRKRAGFIVAGAVLLWEIFGILGIEEMKISEYALGEGVVSEMLARECDQFDVNANARWRSVLRLASWFGDRKRVKFNRQCAVIAKEIAGGINEGYKLGHHRCDSMVFLDEKDLECLEAAILLHDIGRVFGKRRYHKQSYHIIKHGSHLYGYSAEEVELIALLARHHRKKFPNHEHDSLHGLSGKAINKLGDLCAIMRVSLGLALQQQHTTSQGLEVSLSQGGFELILKVPKDQHLQPDSVYPTSADIEAQLKPELDHFEEVFGQKLSPSRLPASPPLWMASLIPVREEQAPLLISLRESVSDEAEILPLPSPSDHDPACRDGDGAVSSSSAPKQRLVSLDVFRGLSIACMLMILADDAGGAFPSLNHSPWLGVTIADFAVPFFLFAVGVSLGLVFKKVPDKTTATKKVVWRTVKLFLLGVLLQVYVALLYGLYVPNWEFNLPSSSTSNYTSGAQRVNASHSQRTLMAAVTCYVGLHYAHVIVHFKVDVKHFRKSTALLKWMGMNAFLVYALAACELFPAAIQGFYWRSPENNLPPPVGFAGDHHTEVIADHPSLNEMGHFSLYIARNFILVSSCRLPPHERHLCEDITSGAHESPENPIQTQDDETQENIRRSQISDEAMHIMDGPTNEAEESRDHHESFHEWVASKQRGVRSLCFLPTQKAHGRQYPENAVWHLIKSGHAS
ncbi:hypothetical protein ACLOJK_026385 [Asimina triloba]